MTTDFRALCAELVETWDATADFNFNDFGHAAADIVDRARAALATPSPEPPTVMEIIELSTVIDDAGLGIVEFTRAVLKRWGHA